MTFTKFARLAALGAWAVTGGLVLALQATHFVFARMLGGIASGQKYSIESSWPSGSRS